MLRLLGARSLSLVLLIGVSVVTAPSLAAAQGSPREGSPREGSPREGSPREGSPPQGSPPAEPSAAEVAEARHSFEVASTAFEQGDYETAAAEFRAAYELLRHPDLLFNVYLAEERAGRHAEALSALEGYLERATVAPEQRAMLERRAQRLRERVARAQAGEPAAAIEDEVAPEAPIALSTPGAPVGGEGEMVDTGPPTAAVATLIAAGVLAVSFAALAIASEVEDQSLASSCGRDAGRWCSEDRLGTLEALNVAADASWIGAAALGALGVVLLFALPPERRPASTAPSAAIAPWIAPGTAGIAGGARF